MTSYDNPHTLAGQLQRGRGAAVRRALDNPGAADAVYACVISDSRWDRQVDQRDSYLAGLIQQLGLSLAPIERHLAASDGDDAEDVELALQVLAVLPFAGHRQAATVLRRYVLEGRHWHAALDAIEAAGAWKLPGLWDGLADDVVASHGHDIIRDVAQHGGEPWVTWAETVPEIRRILGQDTFSRRPGPGTAGERYRQQRQMVAEASTEDLVARLAAGGAHRRQALEELGRRGNQLVLDLAEDPTMRNAAQWIPGMPQALHHLGPAAVPRARSWATGDDAPLAELGMRVLSEHGDRDDIPTLLAALRQAITGGAWCLAEIPARGLGRLRASEASDDLVSAWEVSAHSRARKDFLAALQGCAPDQAEPFAEEALYDCEPSVQQLACTTATDNGQVRTRLRQLADDRSWPEVHDAAKARLATLHPYKRCARNASR